jgi:diguanylate cyclase (GGDEF)-like protein
MKIRPPQAPPPGSSGLPNLDNFDYEATGTHRTDTQILAPASTRRRPARAVLTIVEGADAGRMVALDSAEILIGRASECALVLPDPGVSRKHARVLVRDDGLVLEDLDSKNGTFIDGRSVRSESLEIGDVFFIGPSVKIRLSMMESSEERLAHQLYDSSMRDALTNTFNRRYFVQRLSTEVAFAVRHATPLSVAVLDLDHFKRVNDTYGHPAGDRLLQSVARTVARSLRSEDVLARVGGEELAVLLRGTGMRDAVLVAERIRLAVAATSILVEGEEVRATVSIGLASTTELERGGSHDALVTLADERLYEAKSAGRNTVRGGQ